MRRSFLDRLRSLLFRKEMPEEIDPRHRAGLAMEKARMELYRAHHILENHRKAHEHACRSGANSVELEARERDFDLARHEFANARELLLIKEEEFFNCQAIAHNTRLLEASGEVVPMEELAENFRNASIAHSALEARAREIGIHQRASVRHHGARQADVDGRAWERGGGSPLESPDGMDDEGAKEEVGS